MNSSSLNEHLFIRNLVDSHNCACGRMEERDRGSDEEDGEEGERGSEAVDGEE